MAPHQGCMWLAITFTRRACGHCLLWHHATSSPCAFMPEQHGEELLPHPTLADQHMTVGFVFVGVCSLPTSSTEHSSLGWEEYSFTLVQCQSLVSAAAAGNALIEFPWWPLRPLASECRDSKPSALPWLLIDSSFLPLDRPYPAFMVPCRSPGL